MSKISRKHFVLSGLSLIPLSHLLAGRLRSSLELTPQLQLSFSTLGCPDWSFDKIIDFAAASGYTGIEVRGILHEMDLPKVPEFSDSRISETLQKMAKRGLSFVDLGSSAAMHLPEGPERVKSLDEGRRFIDLSVKLKCPFIRVFPNELPRDTPKEQSIARIVAGLKEMGDHARGTGVTVLMESHGQLVHTPDLLNVMKMVNSAQVGLIWDICNMWAVTGEEPAEVYKILKSWIRHTHIKDFTRTGDKINYVFLGKGITPIFKAIDLLVADGYNGFYSFEWEKLWHPEIAAPEIAIPDYPQAMKKHFS